MWYHCLSAYLGHLGMVHKCIQCYQAKGEKVEIHIFMQVNGILIAEMLMHY